MHEPPKKYDPSRASQFVHRVPLWTRTRGPEQYMNDIAQGGYQQVVALQDFRDPERNQEHPLLRYIGPALGSQGIQVHNLNIKPTQSFSEAGKQDLVRASGILADAVRGGTKTAVTCDFGIKRTGRTLYLMHRRLGASHEEALAHSNPNSDDVEHLRQLYKTGIAGQKH